MKIDVSAREKLTGERTATGEHLALADDIFDGFEFTFEDDEEARLFTFTDEPLARLEVNVGRASREPASFLFFDTRKNWDFFEIFRSNHCVHSGYAGSRFERCS